MKRAGDVTQQTRPALISPRFEFDRRLLGTRPVARDSDTRRINPCMGSGSYTVSEVDQVRVLTD